MWLTDQQGLEPSHTDLCVFLKKTVNGIIMLGVYGEGLLIVHTDRDACDVFVSKMAKEFNFTDQGTPTGLGIEIEQTESDITLCQTKYIEKLAETFLKGEANSKEHKTPACQGLHELFEVATDSKAPVDPDIMALYHFLVGSLLYTAMTVPTRRQLRRRHAEPGAQPCTPMSPSSMRQSASSTTSYSPRTWASATFVAPPRGGKDCVSNDRTKHIERRHLKLVQEATTSVKYMASQY